MSAMSDALPQLSADAPAFRVSPPSLPLPPPLFHHVLASRPRSPALTGAACSLHGCTNSWSSNSLPARHSRRASRSSPATWLPSGRTPARRSKPGAGGRRLPTHRDWHLRRGTGSPPNRIPASTAACPAAVRSTTRALCCSTGRLSTPRRRRRRERRSRCAARGDPGVTERG